MNSKTALARQIAIAFGIALVSVAQAQAPKIPADTPAGYAEELYRDAGRFSDGAVEFQLRTIATGKLSDVSSRMAGDFFANSAHSLLLDYNGADFENPRFVNRLESKEYTDVRSFEVSKFAGDGLPLGLGVFRKLEVTTRIGKESRSHEAVEFCWSALDHCEVVDGALLTLDSDVRDSRKILAEGAPVRVYPDASDASVGQTRGPGSIVCKSHSMNIERYTVTKNAYTREGKSLGILLWRIRVGKGQGVFSCSSDAGFPPACYATATTDVSGSTAEAYGGRKSKCSSKGISPEDRNTGKLEFITGCGVGNPRQESTFKIDVQGTGMQQDLKVSSYDAVNHFNQKAITDSCVASSRPM